MKLTSFLDVPEAIEMAKKEIGRFVSLLVSVRRVDRQYQRR